MSLFCHDMKKGQIYRCESCGFELQVVTECEECGEAEGACSAEQCSFTCCDEPLKLKE